MGQKPCLWVKNLVLMSKNMFLRQKQGFGVKNRGSQKFQTYENFRICSIPNFPKIKKYDVRIEIQNLRKTHSNLNI